MVFETKRLSVSTLIMILATGFFAPSAYTQPPLISSNLKDALVIEKLSLPIDFDGVPDEEAWNAIVPLNFIMHSPVFGKDPSEKTDTRIACDDKYLYFSSRLFFDDPSMSQSASLKRDYMGMGGDWFGVILDIKYGLTNNMVMDLTVNTDFAQVELDEQQINLTRYSLYFPKKRMFFLERSSAFDFSMGRNTNLTREIPNLPLYSERSLLLKYTYTFSL